MLAVIHALVFGIAVTRILPWFFANLFTLLNMKAKIKSTGCEKIDQLMNGANKGDLIQWAGPISCGKTQLAHLTCLDVLLNNQGHVIFIDSGSSFSAKRIVELYYHSDRFEHHRSDEKIKNVLERLILIECFDYDGLIAVLDEMIDQLDIPKGVEMMFIDSIGSILSCQHLNQEKLNAVGNKLRCILKKYEFPIIAINNAVGFTADEMQECSNGERATSTKPALGYHWMKFITKSLYFTPSSDRLYYRNSLLSGGVLEEDEVLSYQNAKGIVFPVVECQVEYFNGTKYNAATLYIGKLDILAF
jgi:hypothetical protein